MENESGINNIIATHRTSWTILFVFVLLLNNTFIHAQSNYQYDADGRLIADLLEGIVSIEWNDYNKVVRIIRSDTCHAPDVEFSYDAIGNRVTKLTKPRDGRGLMPEYMWRYTHYITDPKGNCLSIYERDYAKNLAKPNQFDEEYKQAERDIYANTNRLGYQTLTDQVLLVNSFLATIDANGVFQDTELQSIRFAASNLELPGLTSRGTKRYEIQNQTNNITAVVNDRKLPIAWITMSGEVISAFDYFPFGMSLPERNYRDTLYRYGFNGREKDDAIKGQSNSYDFAARFYDPRVARFMSIDPLTKDYASWSPYIFAGNSPIRFIDENGEKPTDRFKSVLDAANDFGKLYNSLSIIQDREFGATIYEVVTGYGKSYFTYSVPNRGGLGDVTIPRAPAGTIAVADIHSHTGYHGNDKSLSGSKFSGMDGVIGRDRRDIQNADAINEIKKGWISFLTTPDGSLLKYEPEKKRNRNKGITVVHRRLPSDPKDPHRKNRINPKNPTTEEAPYVDDRPNLKPEMKNNTGSSNSYDFLNWDPSKAKVGDKKKE